MKKGKILYLFPLAGLLLSGCSFAEFKHSVGSSWVGEHILHPVYDPIKNLINGGEKEEQKSEEEKPAEETTATATGIEIASYKTNVEQGYDYKKSDVSLKVTYSDESEKSEEPEQVSCDTSTLGEATLTVTHKGFTKTATVTVIEKVQTGTLEAPLSLTTFNAQLDKLIDYDAIEENKTVTDKDHLFFIKGKVTSNYAPNDNGEIQYLNLVDPDNANAAVTGYYVLVDSSVTETIEKDKLIGTEVVVKGYGALYNKRGTKTYEIMKKDNDNRAYLMNIVTPEPTEEPPMQEKSFAEIVAGTPTKGQAYISRAQIKSWANNGGVKADDKSEYGSMILTDGEHEVFVYGSSPVSTDLAWNATASEYVYTSSKEFLTNDLTKDLQPGYYIDFYGVYFDYQGTREMTIIITGSEYGELPVEPEIPEGQTKVSKTSSELQVENEWTICEGSAQESDKFSEFDLDPNIKVSFGGTGNTATYWKSGSEIRVYGSKGQSDAFVEFTGAEGVTIVSIKLTFSLSKSDGVFPLTSNEAAEVNDSSAKYVLQCSEANACQLRIKAFEVLYTGGAPTQKVLQSISVEAPTKTDYYVGESLELAGMVVTGHYLLGEEAVETEITEGYDVSQKTPFAAEDVPGKAITVTYQEKTATFDVTISEKEAELLNLTIEGDPQTEYYHGDDYSLEGLEVYANYDDDSKVKVTETANLAVSKATAEYGDTSVTYTASYGGKNVQREVQVSVSYKKGSENLPYTVAEAREIATATAVADQCVTGIIYKVDSFNSNYGSITYWISDDGAGNSANKDGLQVYGGLGLAGAAFESIDDLAIGDEVVVKGSLKLYNSTTYELDKNNVLISKASPTLEDISLSGTAETNYVQGANVGHEGLTVTAEFSNGGHVDVTDKAEWTYNGQSELAAVDGATVTITATYGEFSKSVQVTLSVSVPTGDTKEVTIDYDNRGGITTAQEAQTYVTTDGNLTITISRGTANTSNKDIRVYQGETITFVANSEISKIEFTCSGSNGAEYLVTETAGYVTDSPNGTWTGNAKSITFTASTKQVRIKTLVVTYR